MNPWKGNVAVATSACRNRGQEEKKTKKFRADHLISSIKLPLLSYESRMQKPAQGFTQQFS